MHKTEKQWKEELVGKQFGRLTVQDIINRKAICLCSCGNLKKVSIYHLLDHHTTSCGCYRKSKEKADKYKEWCTNNRDLLKEKGVKHSKWYKNNPDEKKTWLEHIRESCNQQEYRKRLSNSIKQYYKDNPDKKEESSKRVRLWCINHPDKVKEQGKRVRLWYKNNPDKVKEKVNKFKEWCANHRDLLKEKGIKHSKWFLAHKKEIFNIANNHRNYYRKIRIDNISDEGLSILKDILAPDDFQRYKEGSLSSTNTIQIKCTGCNKQLSVLFGNIFLLTKNVLKRNLPKCNTCRLASSYEKEIEEYIHSFYNGECVRNSRDIIPPYELDLYYPKLNIAIEVNGCFWHSTIFKHKNSHYLKWKFCKDHNIRLISIFEQDWLYKKFKICTFLKNLFSNPTKINLKECYLKPVSLEDALLFIQDNSIHGINTHNISYYLGLHKDGSLVEVVSVIKLDKQSIEIEEVVTKLGVDIECSLQTFVDYIIEKEHPDYIISYSDNDFFSGDSFSQAGFQQASYLLEYQLIGKYGKIIDENNMDNTHLVVYRCGRTRWLLCCNY